MKTSLVCLLLLAAVVCAAPQAKQTRKARFLQEVKEARLHQQAKQARIAEAGEAEAAETGVEAKVGGKRESRFIFGSPCYGYCYGPYGEYGCYFDECFSPYDILFYDGYCVCCEVISDFQC